MVTAPWRIDLTRFRWEAVSENFSVKCVSKTRDLPDGAWFRLVISVHINLSQLHITILFQTFSLVSRKVLAYMSEASLSLLGDCMFMVGCKCCMVERQISPLLLLDLAILNDYGPVEFSVAQEYRGVMLLNIPYNHGR